MNHRLSPSQINLFLNEPSVWILNKFYGIYGDMGASAKRGNAVESGLNSIIIHGMSYEEAVDAALGAFDEDMKDIYDEKTEDERSIIPDMIAQATELFLDLGQPERIQIRHEVTINSVPMLGIADYDFGSFEIDLKATKRCPSCAENISAEHLRQVAYYHHASGKPQKLAYVTPKKGAIYDVTEDQIKKAKSELMAACKAMWSCYEIEEKQGVEALTTLYPPRDTNSFYWDNKTLIKAQELWF